MDSRTNTHEAFLRSTSSMESLAVSIIILIVVVIIIELGLTGFALYTVITEPYESEKFLWIWLLLYGLFGSSGAGDKVLQLINKKVNSKSTTTCLTSLLILSGLIALIVIEPQNQNIYDAVKLIVIIIFVSTPVMVCIVLCCAGAATDNSSAEIRKMEAMLQQMKEVSRELEAAEKSSRV